MWEIKVVNLDDDGIQTAVATWRDGALSFAIANKLNDRKAFDAFCTSQLNAYLLRQKVFIDAALAKSDDRLTELASAKEEIVKEA
jgi:hypothetical protein